jgi:hypothetical protein
VDALLKDGPLLSGNVRRTRLYFDSLLVAGYDLTDFKTTVLADTRHGFFPSILQGITARPGARRI